MTELLTNYGPIGDFWFDYGGSANPFTTTHGCRDVVQSLQPKCLTIVNGQAFTAGVTADISEHEIYNGGGAITSPNTDPAEECTTIFAPGTDTPPLDPSQGPYYADANYACVSAASIIAEINRVNALNCNFLLNAPANQTGQIDSSIVSVLATVGAGI